MSKAWYTLTVQSNHELKAKEEIELKLKHGDDSVDIEEVFVPIKKVLNMKEGKKKISEERTYKGYVFIHADMTDELYVKLKSCTKVKSIIGTAGKATKIPSRDIAKMKEDIELSKDAPVTKSDFVTGELIRIIEGPFEGFEGSVAEVIEKKETLKVSITVFGQNQAVEINKKQVEKIT